VLECRAAFAIHAHIKPRTDMAHHVHKVIGTGRCVIWFSPFLHEAHAAAYRSLDLFQRFKLDSYHRASSLFPAVVHFDHLALLYVLPPSWAGYVHEVVACPVLPLGDAGHEQTAARRFSSTICVALSNLLCERPFSNLCRTERQSRSSEIRPLHRRHPC
jgi:hypothetical protein